MNSAFPKLASYVKRLNLPKGDLLTEAPKGWESFIGTAFDRRLRYEYEPDYTDDVLEKGAELVFLVAGYDISEGLTDKDLNVRSLYAAIADTTFRNPREGEDRCVAFLTGPPEIRGKLIADIQELLKIAREKLNLSSPKFGPTFGIGSHWIGGADADVIDDGCLIDVKCVKDIRSTAFIRQVIAYVLLDVENEHALDSVGVYLARQGILWKIPLEDIAEHSGMTISELRAQAPWGDPEDIADLKALIRQLIY